MSDEVKPARRRRFQVHLSTAVALMFVAGGLMWANTHERVFADRWDRRDHHRIVGYGWPRTAINKDGVFVHNGGEKLHIVASGTDYSMLAFDIVAALLILFAVWFLCEWWIRSRAARKGE